MAQTPKIKKVSLSLKRLNGGNQNISLNGGDTRSPTISEANFQTPPHKRLTWDENTDYSPKAFDTSFSPSGLLSQSLALDSPEVGWRWTEETPDSEYADSSSTSVGSSSVETKIVRTRGRLALFKREGQRRAMEIEMRRAEKMRADDELKMRCMKFQEHLKSTATQNNNTDNKQKRNSVLAIIRESNININAQKYVPSAIADTRAEASSNVNVQKPSSNIHDSVSHSRSPGEAANFVDIPTRAQKTHTSKNTFSDFFNDSDSDGLLVAATQEIESKIVEMTQMPPTDEIEMSKPPSAVTPTSSCKKKHSSFYMQFLEDDSADDWFNSIDDFIKEATPAKKPRNSLLRYNSMPTTTSSSVNSDCSLKNTTAATTQTTTTSTVSKTINLDRTSNGQSTNMKRHSSSHSLSPGSSSYRRNNLRMRK